MGKIKVAILLLGALFIISLNMKVEARVSSSLEMQIDAKLKLHNKPAIKSIKSEDGDIFDCVDIHKQPAFDHPALKNHTIQEVPNFLLQIHDSSIKENAPKSKSDIFQKWQKSGSCPKGTIPIRRIKREDLLRVHSLERFGMKPPQPFKKSKNPTNNHNKHFLNHDATINDILTDLENISASYLEIRGNDYKGAEADINIWSLNQSVDFPEDFSTAQIWVKGGNSDVFESVEAGWMVNPKFYGDNEARFFVHWTSDSYRSTGCFDLSCSGFVQTNPDAGIGGTFTPVSSKNGEQYILNFGIFLDDSTQNWWLKVQNNITIGYWPSELFQDLKQKALVVQWGGSVSSSRVKRRRYPHTKTVMGSGEFANGLWGNACFMKNIRIMDTSLVLNFPQNAVAKADEPNCYSSLYFPNDYFGGPIFYFGGPGQNPPLCP